MPFNSRRNFASPSPVRSGVNATVKWFRSEKGFGFVTLEDGSADAFLHVRTIERAGYRELPPGARIICDIAQGQKGPQVEAIEAVELPNGWRDHGSGVGDDGIEAEFPARSGAVKFFDAVRGFGFVTPDEGGRDVFLHASALNRSGMSSVEAGQRLRFSTRRSPKGEEIFEVGPG